MFIRGYQKPPHNMVVAIGKTGDGLDCRTLSAGRIRRPAAWRRPPISLDGQGATRERLQQEQEGNHAEVKADRLLARRRGPAGEGAVVHVPARRRAVPAEVVEAAESEQDGPEPREESHEAERTPEIARGARPIANSRLVRPVVGVGVVLAGAVGD